MKKLATQYAPDGILNSFLKASGIDKNPHIGCRHITTSPPSILPPSFPPSFPACSFASSRPVMPSFPSSEIQTLNSLKTALQNFDLVLIPVILYSVSVLDISYRGNLTSGKLPGAILYVRVIQLGFSSGVF